MSTNYALVFDGLNDYITIPHDTSINTNTITVEAWIKATPSSSWSKIIGKGPDDSEVFGLYLEPNVGTFVVESQINGSQHGIGGGIVGDNKWHHVAYTYDGTNQILYVDGIQQAIASVAGSLTSNTESISIGAEVSSTTNLFHLNGTIDEVRIWNVARTQAEIQANMGIRLTGTESGLIGYWNLNEGSGEVIQDLTSNNNDGSLGGGTEGNQPVWVTYTQAVPVVLTGNSDLVVSGITTPGVATLNEQISVSWTVENQGTEVTNANWRDAIFFSEDGFLDVNDIFITDVFSGDNTPLEGGGSYTLTQNLTVPSNFAIGSRYILIVTDFYNNQSETEEANVFAQPITINAADLVVTDATAPASVTVGETVSVSWTVTNQGTVATSNNWYDYIYISSDATLDSQDIFIEYISPQTPLAEGESYTIARDITISSGYGYGYENIDYGLANGSGYLLFVADGDGNQGEADEANNVRTVEIEFNAPDLVVTDATAPASAGLGETVSLSSTVKNLGTVAADSEWYDYVLISDDEFFDNSDITVSSRWAGGNSPLAVGSSYTFNSNISLPNNTAIGDRYLLFLTDGANQQSETDGSNNVRALPIQLTAPNLVVSATAPTSAILGQTISVSWTVSNQGAISANADWYDTVYISDDQIWDSSDTYVTQVWTSNNTPLGAGASYVINQNILLPQTKVGDRYLLFVTDDYDYQGETNETDNVIATPISLNAPDLVVSAATAPEMGVVNGTVNVSWTVTNQGDFTASTDWSDSVYLSTNDIFGDFDDRLLNSQSITTQTPLAAGSNYTINRSINLPNVIAGNYHLLFRTDRTSQQGETDENNNVKAVPITLKAPDLVVSDFTAPTNGIANGTINVSWQVTNQGEVEAPTDWTDTIYFSTDNILNFGDVGIRSQFISTQTPLAAGSNYSISQTITLPNRPAGDYYLLLATDSTNAQGESNEGNNVRAIPITIGVPDLTISGATAPESGALGGTIDVSWTVANQGAVTAPADWRDRIYISTNATWDASDTLVTSESIASQTPLAVASNYTINRSITLPNQAPVGSGYLLFRANANSAQGESNETNNVVAIPFTVNAPNLVVSNGTAPESVSIGATINVAWTVANVGSVGANADWYDTIFISNDAILDSNDQYLAYRWAGSSTPLAAGAIYTANQNITLPNTGTGDRYLLVVADRGYYDSYYRENNVQGETSETDNVYAIPINISAADLIIESATAPSSAVLGDTVALSWTVKNQGTGDAPRNWSDYVYISSNQTLDGSDTLVTSEGVSTQTPLAADTSYTINKNVILPSTATGDRYLLFVTDRDNNQGETNENNNVRAVAINLSAPNLTVSEATAPTQASLGSSIAVSWTVNNLGTTAASADWSDYIYVSSDTNLDGSDTFVTSESITSQTPLTAGGTYNVNRNITLPSTGTGNRYLLFVADGSKNQGETDENDNVRAVAITLGLPDLSVTEATAPTSASQGGAIAVSWTVANQGTIEAATDWVDRVYLSNDSTLDVGLDSLLSSESITTQTPLAAGNSYTINRNLTLPNTGTGVRYLLFVADSSQNQSETNETNNVKAVQIEITDPDVAISAAISPVSAALGETVEVSWTVTNQSSSVAPADWSDYIYISNDQVLDASDTFVTTRSAAANTPLAAGTSYTFTQNINIPNTTIGDRYLLFVADRNNQQSETDETNNIQAVAINLTAADLVVSATAPVSADLGDIIALSWTVTNQGNGTAFSDWSDYVYISDDQTLDATDTVVVNRSAAADSPLAAGASYTVNQNVNLANTKIGDRFLLFVTDNANNQIETSETNNVQAVGITLNAPDLVVSKISAPVEALSGQQIEIAWTITNQGTADATGSWTDNVYLSNDGTIGSDRYITNFGFTGTIAAGESIERRQFITVPIELSGNYRVVISTDANNQVLEGTTNEANNTSIDDNSTQIRLSPFPNLQVSSVTTPPTAFSSQETVVQWTVTNNGTGATSAPFWYDNVWLSLDNSLDDTDIYLGQTTNVSYLNVGESYTNGLTVKLPRGIDSNYYFLVKTDANDNVFEFQNEGDNFGVGGPTDVDLTPPPDFQVTAVNAPAQGFSGQPLTLTWTVTNEGTGRNLETSWYDEVFMSTDDVLDGSDRSLGRFNRSGTLNSGTGYNLSQSVTLPIGVSGDFFFFVRTDALNQVYENVFDSNNTGYDTTATKINLTPPPDLEVEFVDAPAIASASRPLTINYRVTNFGATATPNSSWTDAFYLSTDTQLDTNTDFKLGERSRFGTLDIGVSYDNSATFTLPNGLSGTYYAFVVTDSGNNVFELDNDNNVVFDSTPINISSSPADLVVSATAPTTAEAGKAIRVEWTVTNQGIGDTAVINWTDSIVASSDAVLGNGDDVLLANFERNGLLNPGASYSRQELVTIPFNLIGNYNLFVATDANNRVYEATNEGNNSAVQTLSITRQTPDLQVTGVSIPTTALSGQALTVDWTVKNSGTGKTNALFWYDDVYLSTDAVISNNDRFLGRVYRSGALEGSTEYSVSRSFNLPIDLQGEFYTIVRTDSSDRVLETPFENNNDLVSSGTTNISLSPVADLVIASVDAASTGISSQLLNVTWTVSNDGAASTGSSSWYDAFYLSRDQFFDRSSDTYIGYKVRTEDLAAGASYTDTTSFRIPQGLSGPFYVFAVSDSGNNINELSGELNNVGYDANSTEISLPQPSDLVIGTITIPANAVPGQNATISYTVINQGTNAALGSWFDTIYISADNQWDVGDALFGRVQHNGDVAIGGSYSETLTAALPGVLPGDYYAIVKSDIRNQIPESNENNNLKASLDQFNADAERLDLGTADTGSLAQGQAVYYKVDVAAGETLRVKFDSASTTAANELYIRYGDMPSRSQFDVAFSDALSPDQEVVIPSTRGGTYYILAYGTDVGGGTANYSINADILPFGIESLFVNSIGNQGTATVGIKGAKLTPTTQFVLTDSSSTVIRVADKLTDKTILNPSSAYATFNTDGLVPGNYFIQAIAENLASEPIPLKIINGSGELLLDVNTPANARPNQSIEFVINYRNVGVSDLLPPLILVKSKSGNTLTVAGGTGEFSNSTLALLGVASDAPSGLLKPESYGQIRLRTPANTALADIEIRVINPSDERFDWDLFAASTASANALEWDATVSLLKNRLGETWKEVITELTESTTRAGVGTSSVGINELLAWEIYLAQNDTPLSKQTFSVNQFRLFNSQERQYERLPIFDPTGGFNPATDVTVTPFGSNSIDTSRPTTIIVHGWKNNKDEPWMQDLARETANKDPNRNILIVGWGSGADRVFPNDAAFNINATGIELANQLRNLGLRGSNINFVGHSFGTYVSNVAAGQLGGANSLVALDPANRLGLNPTELPDLNFSKNFQYSVAYGSGDIAGTSFTTANENFYLETPYRWWNAAKEHSFAIDFYRNQIQKEGPFGLKRTQPQVEEGPGFDGYIDSNGNFSPGSPFNLFDRRLEFWQDLGNWWENIQNKSDTLFGDIQEKFKVRIPTIFAIDPNDIIGPAGFGEEKWITASSTLPYTIRFENQASATAPAQQVVITQQLDPDLDFRTYRVGDFGWGDLFFDVPDNRAFYNDRLDLTATKGYYVDVTAGINVTTGEAFWTITTIDPETGEIPEDALAGFLPPNNEDGVGDGFVNYSIRPRKDVQTGAVIDAEARIVFDTEEPIDTPPIFNTIDVGAPNSTINALPATTDTAEFLVTWSGSDDSNGSALANYTIYISDNGSTFTPWLENTTLTEATYIGEPGHTYAFYSVARDNAGNSQAVPSTAQTTIQILGANVPPLLALNQGLTLNEQATGAIANTQLQVTDVDNSATQVIYTLTDIPDNGTLLRNNVALAINDTFTQADIDSNLLNYTHNSSETTSDSFSFTVSDGAGGAIANTTFNITVNPINDTPILGIAIADVTATEDTAFTFQIPTNTFTDVDAGDSLTYTATLENGDALPTWLTFDAATRTFSGTPANNDVTALSIKVTATDNSASSVDDIFTLTVANTNDAPILGVAIANQTATEDTAFSFQIPGNTFSDIDAGDILAYSATLENGSALPTWLSFDTATRTFNGTPANNDVAALSIKVTATDNSGSSINDIFSLTVANTNDAPILGSAIANQTATEDTAFTFTIPENTFADVDAGDSLTYTATLENGDGLPTWLTFDTATRTFSGTPANNDVATLGIKVTATDNSSSSVNDTFSLTVANTNDAPILGSAIADQTATVNNAFTFAIPENTFSDVDAGDILTYSATLENGDGLPSWLTFDTNIRAFSGTPTTDDTGILNIKITASDTQGATVTDIFALTLTASNVINGNDSNNSLSGTPSADVINGFGGDDYIEGLAGKDIIDGGTGRFDRMFGGDGDDVITDPDGILGAHGGRGNDTINITFAANWDNDINPNNAPRSDGKITGGYGNDTITVTMNNSKFFINLKGDEPVSNTPQEGDDVVTLLGTYQNAVVDLGGGNDTLIGGIGSDNVSGGAGNDTIFGFGGNDKLTGNDGDDILVGGAGNDNLTGRYGKDIFSFSSPITDGIDTITDFNSADDKIRVDVAGFGGGLVAGILPQTQFILGSVAQDESDRFIYNQSTGALFFDADGTGSSRQVQIATLSTKPVMDSTNIVVI
jgi:subtilase family serine protease